MLPATPVDATPTPRDPNSGFEVVAISCGAESVIEPEALVTVIRLAVPVRVAAVNVLLLLPISKNPDPPEEIRPVPPEATGRSLKQTY